MSRYATAIWLGTGKEGKGHLTSKSGVLSETPYSFSSRFEEGKGTNPEELIAAAHAGCFTMKLSFVLNEAGFTADKLETKCDITFVNGAITKSHLQLTAKIPGISLDEFNKCAQDAKENCPVSKLLNTEISLDSTLS